jgi:hypothetical protein
LAYFQTFSYPPLLNPFQSHSPTTSNFSLYPISDHGSFLCSSLSSWLVLILQSLCSVTGPHTFLRGLISYRSRPMFKRHNRF